MADWLLIVVTCAAVRFRVIKSTEVCGRPTASSFVYRRIFGAHENRTFGNFGCTENSCTVRAAPTDGAPAAREGIELGSVLPADHPGTTNDCIARSGKLPQVYSISRVVLMEAVQISQVLLLEPRKRRGS